MRKLNTWSDIDSEAERQWYCESIGDTSIISNRRSNITCNIRILGKRGRIRESTTSINQNRKISILILRYIVGQAITIGINHATSGKRNGLTHIYTARYTISAQNFNRSSQACTIIAIN